MKFIITTGDCDHEGRPPRPSGKTIEIIFGNVWRGPRGDIADAEREAWDAKETPEGAQAKADAAQQAATAAAAEALKAHVDDAEIHKTSKQIRADIVEDDVPATIARKTDVEAGDANTLSNAKEYTDDAVAGKADTAAMTEALAGKVDVVAEAGLMSDEEREKLAGIEAGANAYIHPESHPADMITDTDGKVVMTAAERAKLSGIEVAANQYVHPASHPADMIDDTAEKVMMTAIEREKLTGIEAGANAYILPAATASTLGGVKAGDNVTIAEDGTLSASGGGGEYVLPKASASILGGIKIGNNLTMRADGTLDAALGSGTGDGVLTLPYVLPERDADGNITNSAAFVDAWGSILSAYLAAPDSHALYMEIDAGEGLMLRMPCNLMNMGGEADAVQWLISGFTVVNAPLSPSDPVPCKATSMANVVCNAAGEMQSLVMYSSEGIVGADGKPNLLGADDAVIVKITSDATEEQLKAIMQPVLAALQVNPTQRVVIDFSTILLPAATYISNTEMMIVALNAHPLAVGDLDSTWVVKAQVYCKLSNGVIESATGGVTAYELATTDAMTAALTEKASLLPDSLDEQPVTGEFWDGKQVYVRTFTGMTPVEDDGHSFLQMTLEPAATVCQFIRGTVDQIPPCYFSSSAGINFNNNLYWTYDSIAGIGLRILGPCASIINPSGGTNNYMGGKPYRITFKYTKA